MREITERLRGRIFRFGTLMILIVVALAIVIPTLSHGSSLTTQRVGIVGSFPTATRRVVDVAAAANEDKATYLIERSVGAADRALRAGSIDLAVVGGAEIVLDKAATTKNSPADPGFVSTAAQYLGILHAYGAAGLTPAQVARVSHADSVPVRTLVGGGGSASKPVSVVGIILLFFMLTQYCTWILIGVMQEKSSRVVEVLLASVRPIQLLAGKVFGIGLVALGQAALVVAFAFVVGKASGSDLLHGAAPVALLAELFWLVLGYAFYCWLYAAAGSTAERQDQVQTLALPLSIPILVSYIFAITVASSGTPDPLFYVLAYLPPTAPFCMSVLVGLGDATWWEFLASAAITVAATFGMARFAAGVYRRAVLRTGARVHLRELFAHTGRA